MHFQQLDRTACYTGADPGFLEMGFICIKVYGLAMLILSHFSSISHENEIIWSHWYHFHRIFKNGDREGV